MKVASGTWRLALFVAATFALMALVISYGRNKPIRVVDSLVAKGQLYALNSGERHALETQLAALVNAAGIKKPVSINARYQNDSLNVYVTVADQSNPSVTKGNSAFVKGKDILLIDNAHFLFGERRIFNSAQNEAEGALVGPLRAYTVFVLAHELCHRQTNREQWLRRSDLEEEYSADACAITLLNSVYGPGKSPWKVTASENAQGSADDMPDLESVPPYFRDLLLGLNFIATDLLDNNFSVVSAGEAHPIFFERMQRIVDQMEKLVAGYEAPLGAQTIKVTRVVMKSASNVLALRPSTVEFDNPIDYALLSPSELVYFERGDPVPHKIAFQQLTPLGVLRIHNKASQAEPLIRYAWLNVAGTIGMLRTDRNLATVAADKELAKKTHRGLEGLVLKGRHAGGRTFGYDTVPADDGVGKTLVINQSEAPIVRRIFQMSANGTSLKKIAMTLNRECVQPPRPRAGKKHATWCPNAIREMLYRDLYMGRLVWNTSRFVKVPGTNKRVRRARPETEWRVVEREDLRIIDPPLWQSVRDRLTRLKDFYVGRRKQGLLQRAATSAYLFSGILKCGQCGGNLVIVTRNGPGGQYRKYGCSQHFYRGACPNNLLERQDSLEQRLLRELQEEVLKPQAIEYVIQAFGLQLKDAFEKMSSELAQMRERKTKIEAELRRLAETAARTGPSGFLIEAINDREQQLRDITDRLLSTGPGSVESHLAEIRAFVTKRLSDLQGLLAGDTTFARAELKKHVEEIRMTPQLGNGKPHYLAEGAWNLLGNEKGPAHNTAPLLNRMVAGGGFEPPTFGL